MFIGHFGPAAWDTQRGKGVPMVTLWQGFLAVQAMDILFSVLAIFGIEGTGYMQDGVPLFDIPWSHSLVTSALLALAVGALFRALKPSAGMRGFWVMAGLVFSHWLLDLIVHRPDLPLYPGSEIMMGWGLWNMPVVAFILETGLLAGGLLYWQCVTREENRKYTVGIWALFAFLVTLHIVFIFIPGLQVQAGTFDLHAGPQGRTAGVLFLITFALITWIVALLERGRPSKY